MNFYSDLDEQFSAIRLAARDILDACAASKTRVYIRSTDLKFGWESGLIEEFSSVENDSASAIFDKVVYLNPSFYVKAMRALIVSRFNNTKLSKPASVNWPPEINIKFEEVEPNKFSGSMEDVHNEYTVDFLYEPEYNASYEEGRLICFIGLYAKLANYLYKITTPSIGDLSFDFMLERDSNNKPSIIIKNTIDLHEIIRSYHFEIDKDFKLNRRLDDVKAREYVGYLKIMEGRFQVYVEKFKGAGLGTYVSANYSIGEVRGTHYADLMKRFKSSYDIFKDNFIVSPGPTHILPYITTPNTPPYITPYINTPNSPYITTPNTWPNTMQPLFTQGQLLCGNSISSELLFEQFTQEELLASDE